MKFKLRYILCNVKSNYDIDCLLSNDKYVHLDFACYECFSDMVPRTTYKFEKHHIIPRPE